jgi:hypothetical protein
VDGDGSGGGVRVVVMVVAAAIVCSLLAEPHMERLGDELLCAEDLGLASES